jgi:hypothetical protein
MLRSVAKGCRRGQVFDVGEAQANDSLTVMAYVYTDAPGDGGGSKG